MINGISLSSIDKNIAHLKLASKVDENTSFKKIFLALNGNPTKKAIINCNDLTYINSAGIRSLINFIEELIQNVESITYSQCPITLVSQFNMVKGFFPKNVTVESFYCPYFNPTTDEEKKILVFSKDILNNEAPSIKDENENELEFDGFKDKYFQFLSFLDHNL